MLILLKVCNMLVNDALIHATTNLQQAPLQFVKVMHAQLIDSLLDDASYIVGNRLRSGCSMATDPVE